MYRLKIDSTIEGYAQAYKDSLFKRHNCSKGKKFQKPDDRLKIAIDQLKKRKKTAENTSCLDYLKKLKNELDSLILLKPSDFKRKCDEYDLIFDSSNVAETKIKLFGKKQEFYKHIVYALRYDDISWEFAEQMKKIPILSCVYCNMIDVNASDDDATDAEGEVDFEIDHYKCKSKHPFLCISFYNLFPCCSKCNKKKSDLEFDKDFCLYVEEDTDDQNPFEFSTKESVLLNEINETFKIHFKCKNDYAKELYGKEHLNMEKRYNCTNAKNTLKKILERRFNNPDGLDVLKQAFPDFNGNRLEFILQTSSDIKKCHQKSYTKLSIDFAKEQKIE